MLLISTNVFPQLQNNEDYYRGVFFKVQAIASRFTSLWDKDIYGPVLLVDPKTHKYIANTNPENNVVLFNDTIYEGYLPKEMHVYNTIVDWKGKTWAMAMLPLSNIEGHDSHTVIHELAHATLKNKGFPIELVDINHVNAVQGKVLIRLELEILKKLLNNGDNYQEYLVDALMVRKLRLETFPNKIEEENKLELNEGLAEYTALIMHNFTHYERASFYTMLIDKFIDNPLYDRRYAYITTPTYGFYLSKKGSLWTQKLNPSTNLTDFFIKGFGINASPQKLDHYITKYHLESFKESEIQLAENNKRIKDSIAYVFMKQSHLEIDLDKMSFSSKFRNQFYLDDLGKYYKGAKINDTWGELIVEGGGILLTNDFKKAYLTEPKLISNDSVVGNGYKIKFLEGYRVEKKSNTIYHMTSQ